MFSEDVGRSDRTFGLGNEASTAAGSQRLSELLERSSDPPLPSLVAAAARELRVRIARGEPARVEEYLKRFPALREDPELLADLVYAEYCARRTRGEKLSVEAYAARFPSLQHSLARLFCLHSMLAENPEALSWLAGTEALLPDVGQQFLDFELIQLLGQGAFARVFLARQESLAQRLVVVKITSGATHEHETLARLGHPHIVPVYSVHRDATTGLTAICMPYQAAVSMATVAAAWSGDAARPTQARDWLEGAARRLRAWPPPADIPSWSDRFPEDRDFIYATAWLMRHAADALAHAHARNIFHLDLKPSNLLITAEGQPLLVDFNLSWTNLSTEGHQTLVIGGTLPYMPPEQIEALRKKPPGAADPQGVGIGPYTDVFSLAATFYELLSGQLPFGAPKPAEGRSALLEQLLENRRQQPPALSRWHPGVPRDLDYLFLRCLDPDPGRRIQSASELVEALDAFLANRVIPCYPSRDLGLRSRRFVQRNRRALLTATFVLGVAILAGSGTWLALHRAVERAVDSANREQQPRTAEEWFWEGVRQYHGGRHQAAIGAMREAIRRGYRRAEMAHFYQGLAYAQLDRDRDAIEAYSKAIRLQPSLVYAYVARCLIYALGDGSVRDLRAAERDARTAWELVQRHGGEGISAEWLVDLARCFAILARRTQEAQAKHELLARAAELVVMAHRRGMSRDQIEQYVERDEDRALEVVLRQEMVVQQLVNK